MSSSIEISWSVSLCLVIGFLLHSSCRGSFPTILKFLLQSTLSLSSLLRSSCLLHAGQVVNRVSQKVVEEERFDSRVDLGSPTMLGLCSDTAGGAFYAFDENSIYEVRTIALSLLGGAL